MFHPITTTQFKRDVKLATKRCKNLEKLEKVMLLLLEGKTLPSHCRDHWLSGLYANRRECHFEPDWLLIYKPEDESIIFERTGTHADLFK